MNPAVLVFAALFAVAGFQEARRFERQHGTTPWRWDPWVWAVVMFLSWVIGLILLAIAERQGRARSAPSAPYGSGYGAGFPQAAVAAAAPVTGYGVATAMDVTPSVTAPVAAAPTTAMPAAMPAAMWAADPTGRHQYRWWDGALWTPNVSTNGVVGQDPI